ncbi:hypothetical protein NQ318_013029 [Aromia moschata]|uniref:Uncharacterized protein n=1 Tax=Aromia moschata TaxID=1265417 RepID=A0AAV8Y417_9CUCU|nr:hypothetical protein NQ318_013029 [Aromia moschata]
MCTIHLLAASQSVYKNTGNHNVLKDTVLSREIIEIDENFKYISRFNDIMKLVPQLLGYYEDELTFPKARKYISKFVSNYLSERSNTNRINSVPTPTEEISSRTARDYFVTLRSNNDFELGVIKP